MGNPVQQSPQSVGITVRISCDAGMVAGHRVYKILFAIHASWGMLVTANIMKNLSHSLWWERIVGVSCRRWSAEDQSYQRWIPVVPSNNSVLGCPQDPSVPGAQSLGWNLRVQFIDVCPTVSSQHARTVRCVRDTFHKLDQVAKQA